MVCMYDWEEYNKASQTLLYDMMFSILFRNKIITCYVFFIITYTLSWSFITYNGKSNLAKYKLIRKCVQWNIAILNSMETSYVCPVCERTHLIWKRTVRASYVWCPDWSRVKFLKIVRYVRVVVNSYIPPVYCNERPLRSFVLFKDRWEKNTGTIWEIAYSRLTAHTGLVQWLHKTCFP